MSTITTICGTTRCWPLRQARAKPRRWASKSTFCRLEGSREEGCAEDRYKRIGYNQEAIDLPLVDLFLQSHSAPPEETVLDLDVTDPAIHGKQEGRFFHGFYGH